MQGRSAVMLAIFCIVTVHQARAQTPAITGITPVAGQGGDTLIVRGTGFGTRPTVFFELGRGATISPGQVLTRSDSLIAIVLSPFALTRILGSARVGVTTAQGAKTYSRTNFVPTPALTSFTSRARPGERITIVGEGMVHVHTVRFTSSNSTAAEAPSGGGTDSELTVIVPHNVATGPIALLYRLGTLSSTDTFYVAAFASTAGKQPPIGSVPKASASPSSPGSVKPVITSVHPHAGHGGDTLVVRGSGFGTNFGIVFAVSETSTTFSPGQVLLASDTVVKVLLTRSVLKRITGPVRIKIVNAAGKVMSRDRFTPAPFITSFTRQAARGTTITIYGELLERTAVVKFRSKNNQQSALARFIKTDSVLTVMVPDNAGNGPISVMSASGHGTTSRDTFEVLEAPLLAALKIVAKPVAPKTTGCDPTCPDPPAGTGKFRIQLPGRVVTGQASFICQLTETTSQIAIILGGDGILGGITGKVRRIGPGTYEIMEDEERGIVVAVARLQPPVASYPASSGTLTITEWTRKVIRGSFVYRGSTEDLEGITREHSLSGSFAAVPTPGC